MPTSPPATHVTSLTAVRAAKMNKAASEWGTRTSIVRIQAVSATEEIVRFIGVNQALSIAELNALLPTVFGIDGHKSDCCTTAAKLYPALDPARLVGEYLAEPGEHLHQEWGLWSFDTEVLDIIPRDIATPDIICIAGVGNFGPGECDPQAINATLTGSKVIHEVLALAHEEVVDIIRTSGIYDFVPLLKAIDFSRTPTIDATISQVLSQLPIEKEPHRRQAFWICVLAFSCMSSKERTDYIISSLIDGLDLEGEIDPASARLMCQQSLAALASLGAGGRETMNLAERMDIYRELLRR
ncbi:MULTISPECIES: hypothetical protein [unclassified Corynebacterium]|uniref:hypothetical protein n=1 Tax=unclassified Corynebacterium TaxID=2624378 RepID=UPI00216774F6|nr:MULTISPECIES: hypothetical protein [unclassified Corynebacterium]MCS4490381.1 hypothetical protein [Corynebacterium sp. ES2775-CONJ]MCS4492161.1 hypothetical protein [Corynebacterium sp. ES2715-CONJ3]